MTATFHLFAILLVIAGVALPMFSAANMQLSKQSNTDKSSSEADLSLAARLLLRRVVSTRRVIYPGFYGGLGYGGLGYGGLGYGGLGYGLFDEGVNDAKPATDTYPSPGDEEMVNANEEEPVLVTPDEPVLAVMTPEDMENAVVEEPANSTAPLTPSERSYFRRFFRPYRYRHWYRHYPYYYYDQEEMPAAGTEMEVAQPDSDDTSLITLRIPKQELFNLIRNFAKVSASTTGAATVPAETNETKSTEEPAEETEAPSTAAAVTESTFGRQRSKSRLSKTIRKLLRELMRMDREKYTGQTIINS